MLVVVAAIVGAVEEEGFGNVAALTVPGLVVAGLGAIELNKGAIEAGS